MQLGSWSLIGQIFGLIVDLSLLLMTRSRNSKISRAIRAAVREQELVVRNIPEPQRPAPREPPSIEQHDQLLRQANL